jgi:hypothetical protein
MNSDKARNTYDTPQKKMLTLAELIAVGLYLTGYTIIALAIVVVTMAIRSVIELKVRKTNKNNTTALVVNCLILIVAIVFLVRIL